MRGNHGLFLPEEIGIPASGQNNNYSSKTGIEPSSLKIGIETNEDGVFSG